MIPLQTHFILTESINRETAIRTQTSLESLMEIQDVANAKFPSLKPPSSPLAVFRRRDSRFIRNVWYDSSQKEVHPDAVDLLSYMALAVALKVRSVTEKRRMSGNGGETRPSWLLAPRLQPLLTNALCCTPMPYWRVIILTRCPGFLPQVSIRT